MSFHQWLETQLADIRQAQLDAIQSDETGDTLYSAHPSLTQDMYRGTIALALLRWIGHLEQFSQITNQQDKDDA